MTNATEHETLTSPTTTNPCPIWCGLPAGHGYESPTVDEQQEIRYHTTLVGVVPVKGLDSVLGHYGDVGFTVSIDSEEAVTTATGEVSDTGPHVAVSMDSVQLDIACMTADEALDMSSVIRVAAEKLRRLQRGEQA